MATRVQDKDNGYAKFMAAMHDAKATITVGIQAEQGAEPTPDGKATVIDVGTYNEFGTSRIPERSFIRAWFDEGTDKNRATIEAVARNWLKSVAHGGSMTFAKALEQIGLRFVGEIQARIAAGVPPPNAPSTAKRKGSDKPLINTGQLRSSIRHKVLRKGA